MPASAVSPMSEANKRALIVAFYLSKFDRKGIRALGYGTAEQAFADLGEKLEVNKNTIKQMRDSFDPYCSVVRAGWHQRPILRSRANVIAAYDQASFEAMLYIVQTLIDPVQSAQAVAPYLAPIDENARILKSPPMTRRMRPAYARAKKPKIFSSPLSPNLLNFAAQAWKTRANGEPALIFG